MQSGFKFDKFQNYKITEKIDLSVKSKTVKLNFNCLTVAVNVRIVKVKILDEPGESIIRPTVTF